MRWLKQIFWYIFSWESQQRWWGRHAAEIRAAEPTRWPFGEWLGQRLWLCAFLHLAIVSVLAETGVDGLEPLVINWFWAPFIAMLGMPDAQTWPSNRLGLLIYRHPYWTFWIGWVLGAIVVPILIWPTLVQIDLRFAHPLRDAIGSLLGLGGQTGLLILLCSALGVMAAWESWLLRRQQR